MSHNVTSSDCSQRLQPYALLTVVACVHYDPIQHMHHSASADRILIWRARLTHTVLTLLGVVVRQPSISCVVVKHDLRSYHGC